MERETSASFALRSAVENGLNSGCTITFALFSSEFHHHRSIQARGHTIIIAGIIVSRDKRSFERISRISSIQFWTLAFAVYTFKRAY